MRFDKPTPACDFMIAPLPDSLAVVEALPGPCGALVTEMSLCVENTSVVDVTLERGDVVATVMVDAAEGPGKGPGEGPGKDPVVGPGGATRREMARSGAASVSGAAPKWRALVIAFLFAGAAATAALERGCSEKKPRVLLVLHLGPRVRPVLRPGSGAAPISPGETPE